MKCRVKDLSPGDWIECSIDSSEDRLWAKEFYVGMIVGIENLKEHGWRRFWIMDPQGASQFNPKWNPPEGEFSVGSLSFYRICMHTNSELNGNIVFLSPPPGGAPRGGK